MTGQKMPFTIAELRAAVPAELFHRSLVKSSAYLARDLFMIAVLAFCAVTWLTNASLAVQLALWPVYWFLQGSVMCGVWIIAHECGHRAFCDSTILCDAVGLVLHSALLVPYHPWRISHSEHHKFTNHADRDQAFVPPPRSRVREAVSDSPLATCMSIISTLVFGWWLYFFFHTTGRDYGAGARVNHFEPSSPLFKEKDRTSVIVSDAALAVVVAGLLLWAYSTSLSTVAFLYFLPYMVCNAQLVTITLMQHTHVDVPHYRGDEWTFLRGALATVDRSYGALLNNLNHNIQDSHVAHHLFSTMPHYNAIKATPFLRAKLGRFYHRDDSSVLLALYNVFRECIFVDDPPAEVLVWRTRAELGQSSSAATHFAAVAPSR